MAVYLIRAGQTGPVKIGRGIDPKDRLQALQVGCWEQMSLLRAWEGGEDEEAHLHQMFDDLHIRGEWFSFSKAMLGDVGLTEIFGPKAVKDFEPMLAVVSDDEYHGSAIDGAGGNAAVCRALMIDRSTVAKWRTRGIPGRWWQDIVRLCRLNSNEEITVERLLATARPHGKMVAFIADRSTQEAA